jgi:hypothetical protein
MQSTVELVAIGGPMNRRLSLAAVTVALALLAGQSAHAACKLQLLATIPITFVNNQPMVDASINGKPAHLRFALNSATFFWGSVLKDYGLKEEAGYALGTAFGPGGTADVTTVSIREFKVGASVQKGAHFYVAPQFRKPDEAGLFGSNLFNGLNDIELDFAHNAARVFKADGCKEDDVVYWGGSYSVVDENRFGLMPVKLSGRTVNGTLGVGNEVTFVTSDAARRAGINSQAASSLPMGMLAAGTVKPLDVSIANFPEIVIGDETIRNAPLAVGNIWPPDNTTTMVVVGADFLTEQSMELSGKKIIDVDRLPEIVLGADFIKSHRIYISASQKKVYISYIGGALFEDIYARLGAEDPQKTAKH